MTDRDFIILLPSQLDSKKIQCLRDITSIPALDVFSRVQSGDVECGHTASYYYIDTPFEYLGNKKDRSLVFRTGIPFGLNPYQQYAWFYHGCGKAIMQESHEKHKLITFPAGSPGCQMGGWFKQKVDDEKMLKNLKIRIPGFGARLIERMGAKALSLGGDQVQEVLREGKTRIREQGELKSIDIKEINAIEWQNPYEDEQLGLYDFASYYYYPGFWEPGTTYEIIINQEAWCQLPKSYQQIVETAAAATNLKMLADYDALNGEALKKLQDTHQVELIPFSQKILDEAHKFTNELLQEIADSDKDFDNIYREWKKFRSEIFQWNWFNELKFDDFSQRYRVSEEDEIKASCNRTWP